METTKIIKTGINVAIVLLLFVTACSVAPATVFADEPLNTPNLPDGIILGISFTPQDTAYLQDSMQILQVRVPDWFQYVSESAPFIVSIDTDQGEKGRAAITSCCDREGRGAIVFGNHLGYSWEEDTAESRRITFIGTLVHEVTHLREQRSGRIALKIDFKSCVAAEKPGLEKQLAVKRALYAEELDTDYQEALKWQIAEETSDLKSRALWDFYCGAFQ